jgi:S-methylmethionine-dependent homocysteine/selenocysteine methylase
MALYRDALPQLSGETLITDGGLETTLVFHERIELPEFASFVLMKDESGRDTLREYFRRYGRLAQENGVGLVMECVTWRANADWGAKLGYDADALDQVNRDSVKLFCDLRTEFPVTKMVVSGCIGPRGDRYVVGDAMTADEAEAYHLPQVRTFAETDADMVCALTLTYAEEAIGIVRAAQACNMPVAISFTVETDGNLPSGQSLKDAIAQVDAATDGGPAYFMINCAHPTHFEKMLEAGEDWTDRLWGLRANASCMSHAELDNSEELDEGNPAELGEEYRALKGRLRHLTVVGGCCGTDHRHIEAICKACT